MILADTSIWIEHLRRASPTMERLLDRYQILSHPFVIGELMLSGVHRRPDILKELAALPKAAPVTIVETEHLIQTASLDGRGIGYVDAALLGAVLVRPGTLLWTLDRKLGTVADSMSVAFTAL